MTKKEGTVYDERRVQDTVLALMHLNAHKDKFAWRAWKSFPWEATDGLYERGLISDPKSKAKSVVLTDEGVELAEQLFQELFGVEEATGGDASGQSESRSPGGSARSPRSRDVKG